MSYGIRSIICNKVGQVLHGFPLKGRGPKPSSILPYLKVAKARNDNIEYELNLKQFKDSTSGSLLSESGICANLSDFIKKFPVDTSIESVHITEDQSFLRFSVNKEKVMTETIDWILHCPNEFWKSSALFADIKREKVIIEFSSPNIAKPFHVGHLRSTIIGNFLSNLHEALGHEVIRLNYLGDWGVQFGLLKYGWDAKNLTEKDLLEDSIRKLHDVYVWANQEAAKNPDINEISKKTFKLMEEKDESVLKLWNLFKNLSIIELINVYKRLNITFDKYHGESMYRSEECQEIMRQMESKNLIRRLDDGRKVYVMPSTNTQITLIKSDDGTLYLTRDIAAAIHRYKEFKFDKMYYVVDSGQKKHFDALFSILRDLGFNWARNIDHLRFGRIIGMSTRKGTALFLEDVLNEAKERMLSNQKESVTTKVYLEESELAAECVGLSAVVVANLKHKRKKDYTFDWAAALHPTGFSGVLLQYTHVRLASLEVMCGTELSEGRGFEPGSLKESEAISLVRHIARFDEILLVSYESFETNILPNYLFDLCKCVNKAWRALPVKGSADHVAQARLKMFVAARHTLAAGMKIVGLSPLKKM